jgi:hypothetical protein
MLEMLNSLWFGGRLGYLEQLSIKSALALGHPYTLYSYEPQALSGIPDGVFVRDAREVMSDPRRVRHFEGKYKALGSDFFRYEIFANRLGYWVDLDVIFLRPLDFTDDYVFGWERKNSINGAILKLPADSPMLEELRNIPERNWCPPFFGPRRKISYYLQRLSGHVELENLPWGSAGPAMLTFLAQKFRLDGSAQPEPVFYPVPYDQAEMLFGASSNLEKLVKSDTRAIHMWNSRLHKFAGRPPVPGSYVHKLCERFGVTTD